MIPRWQVALSMLFLPLPGEAEEAAGAFVWKPPEVRGGIFTEAMGMLDREREEYAAGLAAQATNEVARARASEAALEKARRLLALALHLAPRDRRALVTSYQLSRGVVPERVEANYSPEVLARLLVTRAQALERQAGEENLMLARVFTEVAAEMDPKNEDAVYASELQRIDHGRFDWSLLTDVKARKAEPRGAAGELP